MLTGAAMVDPGRPPIRVLYIAGLGHSGSTLLDLLVSSHSRVASVGEIQVLRDPADTAQRRRVLKEITCPCGAPNVAKCPFWQQVESRLGDEFGLSLGSLDMNSVDAETFDRHNTALFSCVSAVSKADWIVDSSKNSERLNRLIRVPGLDVHAVHLVRSPFGVAWSNRRKGRPVYHNAMVYTHNFVYSAIVVQRTRHRVIWYEELVGDPERSVSALMGWLRLEFEPEQMNWPNHPHHNIGGNRMRYDKDGRIRPDNSWTSKLGLADKIGVGVVTAPTRVPRSWLFALHEGTRKVRVLLRRRPRAGAPADGHP